MIKTSLGLDMAATASGLVLLQATSKKQPALLCEKEIKFPKLTGVARTKAIVTEVMEFVAQTKPDRIVVEGYSLGRNANATIPLVELGGLLRFMLQLDGHAWYDPRASEVKKFATGKGNAPKEVMLMAVLKRWGHESLSHNTADAYTLACMGLAQMNRLPEITMEMRQISGSMKARTN